MNKSTKKVCTQCKQERDIYDFHKKKERIYPCNRESKCKYCTSENKYSYRNKIKEGTIQAF